MWTICPGIAIGNRIVNDFSCPVVRIEQVSPIVGADEIELARVFAIDVIVQRGRYRRGDMAIYLPPDAVLPIDLAESLKGHAKLFGERRNRVRPYRLRGAVSEGVLIGPIPQGTVGVDAAAALGIVKYETPIPTPWRGECIHLPGMTVPYDIRSARRYPGAFDAGEHVEITEKLHGTMCAVGFLPGIANPDLLDGDTLIYSKGLGQTGHSLKASNHDNLYVRMAMDTGLRDRLRTAFNGRPATAFGEIYGPAVQDLTYGRESASFALFDVYLGVPGRGRWLERQEFGLIAGEIAPVAPVLYSGRLSDGILGQLASGPTIAGNMAHMREGVIVRPVRERNHPRIGRTVLKYVSPEYLTRAEGTEFQ